jgi:hypothetical protein
MHIQLKKKRKRRLENELKEPKELEEGLGHLKVKCKDILASQKPIGYFRTKYNGMRCLRQTKKAQKFGTALNGQDLGNVSFGYRTTKGETIPTNRDSSVHFK